MLPDFDAGHWERWSHKLIPDITDNTSVEQFFDSPFTADDEIELIKSRVFQKPTHSAMGLDRVACRTIVKMAVIEKANLLSKTTTKTKADPVPTCRVPASKVLFTLDADAEGWGL